MKTILITGIAGCIGSNFANWIIKNKPDWKVIGLDDLSGGFLENVHPSVEMHIRDVGSKLDDIFQNNDIKCVAHFAAYAAERASPFLRKFNYINNLVNTANIINCCIKYNSKILFTSSISVYGFNDGSAYKETDSPNPIDPYGIAKYACELDIKVAHQQHGLKYTILRPHSVIALQQNLWDRYRNVISIWMRQILDGKAITIVGDGEQTRTFSWAEDSMECFWKCVEDFDGYIFNIGSDCKYSLNQVSKILEDVVQTPIKIQYLPPQHEVLHPHSDHTLCKNLLGFKEKTDLREMLEKMWNWAKIQPNRKIKSWDEFEIEQGLYDIWKTK